MALNLLAAEMQEVMPIAVSFQTFVSLCTVQQPDGLLNPDGTPSNVFLNVAGLVNIQCMDSVPSVARLQATEVKDLQEIMSKGLRHMLLNGYYPQSTPSGQIPTDWRAIVDGITYDILGVEHDSQNQMTRLELQLVQV